MLKTVFSSGRLYVYEEQEEKLHLNDLRLTWMKNTMRVLVRRLPACSKVHITEDLDKKEGWHKSLPPAAFAAASAAGFAKHRRVVRVGIYNASFNIYKVFISKFVRLSTHRKMYGAPLH